ncbi:MULTISPECIES: DUF236 domain-containing protein [unclassified Actinobaculum]|uniref:DUF236 domain-containing protein n=1 Tax=unclassified Actinobaculum TaxID=2609299 RepID=UPI000D52A070|nr:MULTISPECIES: DUF236 domain-containing protein [unclassified Actinobaculum]AWE43088.1 hypothetical protein DDD63_10450 [Actinobaculum sp. 313]RTE48526.1 hypothetical protein EKN07_09165 [Actinobaculum sp. 352]
MRPQVSFNGRVVRIAVIVIALFILGWLALTKPSFRDGDLNMAVHCAPIIAPTFGAVPDTAQPEEQTLAAFDNYANEMKLDEAERRSFTRTWRTSCHTARMDRRIEILFLSAASLIVIFSIPFRDRITVNLPHRKSQPTRQATPGWRHHV